jgi:hypothetical protein
MGVKPQQGDVQMAAADGQQQQQGHAAPSGRVPVPRSEVRLPMEVSTHVECKWRDGRFYPARIIERRQVKGEGGEEYEYYVHYRKCERGGAGGGGGPAARGGVGGGWQQRGRRR